MNYCMLPEYIKLGSVNEKDSIVSKCSLFSTTGQNAGFYWTTVIMHRNSEEGGNYKVNFPTKFSLSQFCFTLKFSISTLIWTHLSLIGNGYTIRSQNGSSDRGHFAL